MIGNSYPLLILADNFTSTIKPATLGIPVLGKQPFLDRLKAAGIRYGIVLPNAEDIIETNDAVVFYTNAKGTTAHGFPWINEYIFRIRFDTQDKIVGVDEFTDSTAVLAALAKEKAAGGQPV